MMQSGQLHLRMLDRNYANPLFLLCLVPVVDSFLRFHSFKQLYLGQTCRDLQFFSSQCTRSQSSDYRIRFSNHIMIMTPPRSLQPTNAISKAAEFGLKLKLRKYSQVKFDIAGGVSELLQGRILGANLTGIDWMSPGMLTCRSINCVVGPASIDLNRLARGTIVLVRPVSGQCQVHLTAGDFANFLCHPKVSAAAAAAAPPLGHGFRFLRQCRVDESEVLFAVTWRNRTERLALSQGTGGRAAVRPLAAAAAADPPGGQEDALAALAGALAAFFDALVPSAASSNLLRKPARASAAILRACKTGQTSPLDGLEFPPANPPAPSRRAAPCRPRSPPRGPVRSARRTNVLTSAAVAAAAAAAALPPGAGPGRRQALLRRHGLPPRRPRRRPRRGPGRRSRLRCGAAAAAAGRGPVPEPDHDDILTAAAVAAINAAASLPGD